MGPCCTPATDPLGRVVALISERALEDEIHVWQ